MSKAKPQPKTATLTAPESETLFRAVQAAHRNNYEPEERKRIAKIMHVLRTYERIVLTEDKEDAPA